MSTQPSPLPYYVEMDGGAPYICNGEHERIATIHDTFGRLEQRVTARFIVRACNQRADLVADLRAAREFVKRHSEDWYRSGQELIARLDAAIANGELT